MFPPLFRKLSLTQNWASQLPRHSVVYFDCASGVPSDTPCPSSRAVCKVQLSYSKNLFLPSNAPPPNATSLRRKSAFFLLEILCNSVKLPKSVKRVMHFRCGVSRRCSSVVPDFILRFHQCSLWEMGCSNLVVFFFNRVQWGQIFHFFFSCVWNKVLFLCLLLWSSTRMMIFFCFLTWTSANSFHWIKKWNLKSAPWLSWICSCGNLSFIKEAHVEHGLWLPKEKI